MQCAVSYWGTAVFSLGSTHAMIHFRIPTIHILTDPLLHSIPTFCVTFAWLVLGTPQRSDDCRRNRRTINARNACVIADCRNAWTRIWIVR